MTSAPTPPPTAIIDICSWLWLEFRVLFRVTVGVIRVRVKTIRIGIRVRA